MLTAFRYLAITLEFVLALPVRVVRVFMQSIALNPRLGPLRHVVTICVSYAVFAVVLVYVFAPIRGYTGQIWHGQKLQYDSQRWLATAIYDAKGHFVGTFDPRLDSKRDVNYSGVPIEIANTGYVANPDHKSIAVRQAPEYYWRCLVYHEDRHIGTWLNPFGIDLMGVLKIPVSTAKRSFAARGIRFGVGGSTLSMQLARIIYKTPPRRGESPLEKIRRKLKEWWMAPVIYRELTKDGSIAPFKEWVSNHLWLAQRTGGSDLYGVETASRVVFGKEAHELSVAEQFVLAGAVNKPIILLDGGERLNAVRLDRWRYIIDVRARKCASELVSDESEQKAIWFELTQIAGGPPDPQMRPRLEQALKIYTPKRERQARANPSLRANVLIPAARYGVREEMKSEYGYDWRDYVRGVSLTFDVTENRRFREVVKKQLTKIQKRYEGKINPDYALDLISAGREFGDDKQLPNVVVAAANAKGELVRYFEAKDTASYFGSPLARNRKTGRYEPERESRAIASIGKMIAAIAIANQGRDTLDSVYVDKDAPSRGLESCQRGGGLRRGRKARVAFACSLNRPLEWRAAKLSHRRLRALVDHLGLNMPPAPSPEQATPPSTAVVRGLVTASPRKVHQMAGVVLAALTGRGSKPVKQPTLIERWDRSGLDGDEGVGHATTDIVPDKIISKQSHARLTAFLSAPLCYQHRGKRHGTLKSLSKWCHRRRSDVRLHFAKTGTQVSEDPDATIDAWIAGGIQFANGASYSYVIVVGTGNTQEPWARRLHASQVAAPLLGVLLDDLARDAKGQPAMAAAGRKDT